MKRVAIHALLVGTAILSGLAAAQAKRRPALPPEQAPVAARPHDADRSDALLAELSPGEWRHVRRWIAACLAETPPSDLNATAIPVLIRITPDRQLAIMPQGGTDSRPPGRSKMAVAELEQALSGCGVASMLDPPSSDPIHLLMLINPVTGESRPVLRL